MKLKIAIVVHGRFHAFNLARALINRGHDVTVFTNYPKWAVERFGISRDRVRSFWSHGVLSRLARWLQDKVKLPDSEAALHQLFGRWAAHKLTEKSWDVIYCWSGVSEEILQSAKSSATLTLLMRGSAHIRTQGRLLEEEQQRTGKVMDQPSEWMIAREEREYELADKIAVLSSFAYQSFVAENVPEHKLCLLPLGAELESFRPSSHVVEARSKRIRSGEPLRVLYVGSISFRKGMWDMVEILRCLRMQRFKFRLVGPMSSEAADAIKDVRKLAQFVSKQPQHELPKWYAWGDLFVFPTIEDGFAIVLAQAYASALPILTTTNCSGPDLIREGQTGWVLPVRCSEAFIERLKWCDAHRKELADMVQRIYHGFQPRDWTDVAADFEAFCEEALNKSTVELANDH